MQTIEPLDVGVKLFNARISLFRNTKEDQNLDYQSLEQRYSR